MSQGPLHDRRLLELSRLVGAPTDRTTLELHAFHRLRILARQPLSAPRCPLDVQPLTEGVCAACGRTFARELAALRGALAALAGAPDPAPRRVPPSARTRHEADRTDRAEGYSLELLVDLHQAFEAMALEHRVGLVTGDLDRASSALARLDRWLQDHVAKERALVMPRYEPLGSFPRGAAPEIVENEHVKILAGLAEAHRGLDQVRSARGDSRAVAIVELLDAERLWLGLLEHHDQRERAFVYPRLDGALSSAAKQALIAEMTTAFCE